MSPLAIMSLLVTFAVGPNRSFPPSPPKYKNRFVFVQIPSAKKTSLITLEERRAVTSDMRLPHLIDDFISGIFEALRWCKL
jgi:hypothetical protein